jgi:hypothetical protein
MSIEAMKQALEALEKMVTPRNFQTHQFCQKAYDDLRQAISEAEKQEPEAAPVAKNEGGKITWMIDDWPQNCLLYTHTTPQQRTWVGLTDEEIDGLHEEIKVRLMGTFNTKDIYRVLEAKLKERNA